MSSRYRKILLFVSRNRQSRYYLFSKKNICNLLLNFEKILKIKNLKLAALIAIVLNLVNVSCSSDDGNNIAGLDNVMTIEGNQIAIENGFLAFSQENNSTNGK